MVVAVTNIARGGFSMGYRHNTVDSHILQYLQNLLYQQLNILYVHHPGVEMKLSEC